MPVNSLKNNILENLKQKMPFDNSKIYAQFETMNLRFNYFANLKNTQINQHQNISSNHLHFLKKFINTKPFKIIQCDKNIGTAIVSYTWFT